MEETGWALIRTQADVNTLMDTFGGFHDGCIREAHLWTDHWVGSDLAMSCPGHLDNRIRFLIQRQFKNPAAIELFFDEVTRFNLVASHQNYDSVIFEASLIVREGLVFWSPNGQWSPDMSEADHYTWISARQLRWRAVDWLGDQLRYGPKDLA